MPLKYKRRDADSVKKRADQDGGNFDGIIKSGIDTFRPKQGTNTVRFLPPSWEDPDHYGFDVWVHSYIGADSGTYICPKKMLDKPCPICAAQKEAADAGEEDEAKKLKATKKVLAWVVDRDDRKPIPKVWIMSWSQDKEIATLCHSEKTGKVIMLDDPDKGFDLSFKRTGEKLNTRYLGYVVDRQASQLGDSQKQENTILAVVEENPIPSILAYKDAKYLQAVVDGKTSKKDQDEDDDAPRTRRRGRGEPEEVDDDPPPRSRRARAEPEEADDDPPPRRRRAEPEPEDDDPPPRRRRAEPEEADDDPPPRRRRAEPEEAEDDPPPRRRRAEPEEADDDPPPRRRRAEPEEAEDDPPPRRRRAEPEEADDDPPPRRRRAEPEEEPEDPPPRRRRPAAEPEDEDPPPARPRRVRA